MRDKTQENKCANMKFCAFLRKAVPSLFRIKYAFFGRVFGKRHGDSLGVLFDVSWEKNCIG